MGMNHEAPEFMTVGQVAKRMGATVRTLQYYDNLGLLSPSELSTGGRRLYTARDVVRLHQIQSMKYLGFSLDDIKTRLITLDTPADVAAALGEQASAVRGQIEALRRVLTAIEALREETSKVEVVDWSRYADIVHLLQLGSRDYWFITAFSDEMLDHIHKRFDVGTGLTMLDRWGSFAAELTTLQDAGASPNSPQAQQVARDFWDFVMEFTGGDLSLLPELMRFSAEKVGWDPDWQTQWELVEGFIGDALYIYLTAQGIDPFKEVPA